MARQFGLSPKPPAEPEKALACVAGSGKLAGQPPTSDSISSIKSARALLHISQAYRAPATFLGGRRPNYAALGGLSRS